MNDFILGEVWLKNESLGLFNFTACPRPEEVIRISEKHTESEDWTLIDCVVISVSHHPVRTNYLRQTKELERPKISIKVELK